MIAHDKIDSEEYDPQRHRCVTMDWLAYAPLRIRLAGTCHNTCLPWARLSACGRYAVRWCAMPAAYAHQRRADRTSLFVARLSACGLAAFVFMLVFGIGRAIVARFKSERVIAVMIFCAAMTILFEFLLAIVYCAYYREFVFLSIFVSQFWNDVLLTALLTPAVMTINHALESIFVRRKKASLS